MINSINSAPPLASPLSLTIGGRSFTASVLEDNWPKIVSHLENVFAGSSEILKSLHDLGIQYTLDGTRFKKANAIGDILGMKHFNLPSMGSGKRSFYLPALGMTREERAEFAALPTSELLKQINTAKAQLLG